MADDGVGIVFIFLKEVIGARESYLVNILVYFFSRKTYTMVGHRNGIFPSETCTVKSPTSPLNSPIEESVFSFCVASTALETNSRRKIS